MYSTEVKWRFFYKYEIDPSTKCWNWVMSTRRAGYGQFRTGGIGSKVECAHISSYKIHRGEVPEGLQVLHRCDNPKCVNPKHLFLGTALSNVKDCKAKNRDAVGEKHGNSKLTESQVREIRSSSKTGRYLAVEYGVSFQTISEIKLRKKWKHIA